MEAGSQKVISLWPKQPQKPSLRARFAELFGNEQSRNLRVHGLTDWKKYIPLSRREAWDILTHDLSPQTRIDLVLHKDGRGTLEMRAAGVFHYSDTSGETGGVFDLAHGYAANARIMVEESSGQHGLGRVIRRNLVEFFFLCGVDSFNIHAGYSAGGYTWARFGDLPDSINDFNFAKGTKQPVNERYGFLRPYLGEEDRRTLDAAVAFQGPHDIWRIADTGTDITLTLSPLFNAIAAGKAGSPEASRLLNLFQQGYGFQVLAHMREALKESQKITTGKFLLSGTSWRGSLDLHNPEQMQRAGTYAGGWRYIGFK